MANYIHNQVVATLKEVMNNASYVALTANEITNMDNQNWISIHGYVLKDWSWILVLLTMKQIMDGFNLDNLTRVLMTSLKLCEGISKEHITNKLVSFGVDGVSVFQGV
jgi:hypothetical protein